MFLLGKIISRFFISPALFFLIFLLGGLALNRFNHERLKKLFIGAGILFYIISIRPTKELMVRILEPQKAAAYYDLISTDVYVLLGGGLVEGTPDGDIPTDPAYSRIVKAATLYNMRAKPIIITGGRVYNDGSRSESSVYKKILIGLGIPSEDIITEERSRTTYENVKYTKELLDEMGYDSITLVTSATHIYRAAYTFESVGIEVVQAPAGYLTNNSSYDIMDFIPDSNNLNFFFRAFWEYMGVGYYQLKLMLSPIDTQTN